MPIFNPFNKLNYVEDALATQEIIIPYEEITQTETPPPPLVVPYMDSAVYDGTGKQEQIITISDVSDLGVAEKIVKTQPSGKLPPIDGSLLTNIGLNQLSDVVLTAPTLGQVVKYNGVNWINDTDAGGALSSLTDTNIITPLDNQSLKYNTTISKWVNEMVSYNELSDIPLTFTPSSHTHVKADITDFSHTHVKADITDFSHTHLKADITDFSHTHLKADITDFSHTHLKADITDFSHNHVKTDITDFSHTHLKADITDFSHNHVKADITDFSHTHLKADITDFSHTLDSHSNVNITTPIEGDYLYYDGSNWVNRTFLHSSLKNTANFSFALSNGVDTQFPNTGGPVLTSAVLITNTGGTMTSTVVANAGSRVCLINVNMSCRISNNAEFYLKIWKTGVLLPEYLYLNLSGNVSTEMSMTAVTTLNNNDTVYITVHAG
jgi:hypothetical protein